MYIPQQDDVSVPLKHHTIKNTYSNPIKYDNNVYLPQHDDAKNTIKQTTIYTKSNGQVFGGQKQHLTLQDNAKTTIKETTHTKDYMGIAQDRIEEQRTRQDANNMCIDERREKTTYNRPSNGRLDGNHILNETAYDLRDNYVITRPNMGGLSLETTKNIMQIYSRNKNKIMENNYYTDNINKSVLKQNPYVINNPYYNQ